MNKLITIWALLFAFTTINAQNSYRIAQGTIFATAYHIKYQHPAALDDEIKEELRKFDLSLNPFNEQSIIYKVNNNQNVEVDSFFVTVFNKATEVSEKSKGKFDITCAPLVNAWGFGFSKASQITSQKIDSLKKYVGYKNVSLVDRKVVKKYPQSILNASALAKGYSCDVIARLLESHGIQNYMVEIGGEIAVKGKNPGGVCWMLEVSQPNTDNTQVNKPQQALLAICGGGLATSGDYRNYYIKDGKKYAHTIDPTTGYPAGQNILSATVTARDCMTADAYATTFMVLGLEEACKLGDRIPDLNYYFVYADKEGKHQVKFSKGMEMCIMPSK